MNKKQRLKRAFTITELVIVIAVIAVLAAVLIPTFASVVKSANKSADETYLKNISDTIANYAASNGGEAPKDYPEMMRAVADNGLCDPSNPYLLATKLKEDNVRMVWFPNTTKVQLVDTSRETLLWQTGATRGMGNYALIGTTFDDGKTDGLVGSGCYVLCVAGDKSCEAAAELYYNFYVTCGGDVNKFNPDVKNIQDKGWANCIIAAVNNAKKGYHNDEKVEEELIKDLTTSGSADIKVENETEVRSALATLATIANDAATKDKLNDKQVTLTVTEDMKTNGVDMKDVTLAAIGNSYRKESNIQGGTPASTVSVNYNGLKLKNVNVPSNYVSSGAEFQTADDSGHAKGGYAFTYGMFGSIIAAPGDTVTIENLTIDGVTMDFTGASETINGKQVETFADNAGVIAGYVQGNVVLKNITINGKTSDGKSGFIKGYDAIAGVVGRAYGAINEGERKESKLTLDTVKVSDLDITGERRASGFVGYYGNNMSVEIKNSSLTNVNITAKRNDNNTKKNECWAMVFAHVGNTSSHVGTLTVSKVELTNVATGINFNGKKISDNSLATVLKPESYIYADSTVSSSTKIEECNHLLLVADAKTNLVILSDITFKNGNSSKTYAGNASTKLSKGQISVN